MAGTTTTDMPGTDFLRFGMQNPHESVSDFRRRINAAAQAEDGSEATVATDSLDWMFGPNLRHRGSLHADRWEGTAADLALCENIAIYPVIGWWREREHLARGDRCGPVRSRCIDSIAV